MLNRFVKESQLQIYCVLLKVALLCLKFKKCCELNVMVALVDRMEFMDVNTV